MAHNKLQRKNRNPKNQKKQFRRDQERRLANHYKRRYNIQGRPRKVFSMVERIKEFAKRAKEVIKGQSMNRPLVDRSFPGKEGGR
jgi:hypothetical protein